MPCVCGETPHRQDCPVGRAEQRRLSRRARQITELLERRATGFRTFKATHRALAWFFLTREAWGSAKALPILPDMPSGDGRPNRGADDPKRHLFATIAYAIKLAEHHDRELHPAAPAPIERWLEQHHGTGRAYTWLAEEAGVSQDVVKRRMGQAHLVIRQRLQQGGARIAKDGTLVPVEVLEGGDDGE